ncbi:hypothetical protein [Actinocorallia longicatena]|uniref:Xaa-Pro dipeptidase n=1 Tax=Actinocorallia longicatena TaxID=111803 RepID=A0ABP6Q765_9ACTN
MTAPLLPPAFAGLEPYAATWCLATEAERYARRQASTMPVLREFYDACFPRLEEAIAHCDAHPLDDLPDDVLRLLQLVYSLVMVSMSVEIFQQVKATDAADAELHRTGEPVP